MSASSTPPSSSTGALAALGAFLLWGFMPIYFKQLSHMPALEILGHRIVWSSVLTVLLCAVSGRLMAVRAGLLEWRKLRWLALSALLVGGNWLLFIWAVNNNHLTEASLGYYINPLVNMLLGYLFLGERLTFLQRIAAALAVGGVLLEIVAFGSLPWIAVVLALSFGFYGLLRKQVAVDAVSGLCVETCLLAPAALIYMWTSASPASDMLTNDAYHNLLLLAAGPATTLPLLLFIIASRRLTLTILGFFQYLGPSIMFILAITLYQEPVPQGKWITFVIIWCALALVSWDAVMRYRSRRLAPVA
ncbi:EamA family transporter RarD [Hahella sp. NBU794]|uniref:EamA family transporter RarD n=1 Tax=Hahella sp. NBU794 TaxID=3422590 RepID=UPI003D6F8063